MDWTICSRELERDYAWDALHASRELAELARGRYAPAFEGALTTSRFAVLLRNPGAPHDVILCVSVSTDRKDFRSRPIRTMAFLRAETVEESGLLASFFAEILRKSDAETIYNAESAFAKAVESLYRTKKLDDFLCFCRSLPAADGNGAKPAERCAIPRDDAASRCETAEFLSAIIDSGKPFLIALTDRTPSDVLASFGTMFDRSVVRIFSKATLTAENLPEPASQKYIRAATIGGAVLIVLLVAAIKSCSGGNGGDEANSPASRGIGVENAVPVEGRR